MFLCTLNFMLASMCTLWYFSPKDKKDNGFMCQSFSWLIFKHFGSVALSSLILSCFWVVQLAMRIQIAVQKHDDKAGENWAVICLAKIVSCCIDCFERCVNFLSKQAYVEIVIRSCSYCTGACKSMAIAVEYAVSFSLINGVVECTTTLAVLVITIVCTICSSQVIDNYEPLNVKMNESTAVKIVIFVVSLLTAKMFQFPYDIDIACDTVMHCYAYNEDNAPKSFRDGFDNAKKNKAEKGVNRVKENLKDGQKYTELAQQNP